MTLPSDAAISRGDIMRRLADLERAVSLLAAARGLEASQIGAGGVTITDGGSVTVTGTGSVQKLFDDGSIFAQIGRWDTGFGPVEVFRVMHLDGSTSFIVQSNLLGFESWGMLDGEGTELIACEPNGAGTKGRGLRRPYIPGVFHTVATPSDSTASGTFTTLQKAIWIKQHKAMKVWVEVQVSATTGEIRWRINTGPDTGTIIGGPITKSGNTLDSYGPFAVPGAHMAEFEIELQGRVASGAGATAVRTIAAIGREA